MSIFNITDITPAGAFANAATAAQDSDRRNASRHIATGEGLKVAGLLATLVWWRRFLPYLGRPCRPLG